MKSKMYKRILMLEAGLLLGFFLLKANLPEIFSSLMAFPFEQIGKLLRTLSLSGGVGNILALIIYAVLGLIPVMIYLDKSRKKTREKEDVLLLILSGVLFVALYYLVNPGKAGMLFGSTAGTAVGNAFIGGSIYSVLVAYIALKALRLFYGAQRKDLENYLIYLLGFLNFLFVLNVFGLSFGSYLDARRSFLEGNTDPTQRLFLSELALLLQHLVRALPYFLSIFLVDHLMALFGEIRKDRFSEETLLKAQRLTRFTMKIMAVIVLSNMVIHLLQLVFMKELLSIHGTLVIPVMPMLFALGVLLTTQFVSENKSLKEDNDLFI